MLPLLAPAVCLQLFVLICGLAAAHGGKAPPFPCVIILIIRGYASNGGKAANLEEAVAGKPEAYRHVLRQAAQEI